MRNVVFGRREFSTARPRPAEGHRSQIPAIIGFSVFQVVTSGKAVPGDVRNLVPEPADCPPSPARHVRRIPGPTTSWRGPSPPSRGRSDRARANTAELAVIGSMLASQSVRRWPGSHIISIQVMFVKPAHRASLDHRRGSSRRVNPWRTNQFPVVERLEHPNRPDPPRFTKTPSFAASTDSGIRSRGSPRRPPPLIAAGTIYGSDLAA